MIAPCLRTQAPEMAIYGRLIGAYEFSCLACEYLWNHLNKNK